MSLFLDSHDFQSWCEGELRQLLIGVESTTPRARVKTTSLPGLEHNPTIKRSWRGNNRCVLPVLDQQLRAVCSGPSTAKHC